MAHEEYYQMRAQAGRRAIEWEDEHNSAIVAEKVLGAMAGFLLESARYYDWDAVLRHVNQLATAARVPAEAEKVSLRVLQGGRAT